MGRVHPLNPSRIANTLALFLLASSTLASCTNVGPKSIRNSRFNYNSAIVDTRNEQLLTNLVRLRYRDTPYFIEVSSIATQYVLGLGSSAAVGGLGGDSGGTAAGSLGGSVSYEERPTITYTPLKGQTFVSRLLSPVPMGAIVLLSNSGWRFDRLMRCCVQRINDVWNAPTAAGPTPDLAPDYEEFAEVARLLEDLRRAEALDLRYRRVRPDEELETTPLGRVGSQFLLSLRIRDVPEVATQAARLKEILDLRPDLDEFYLTSNPTHHSPREIGISPRALIGVMNYLSQAVEPPQKDVKGGRVTLTRHRDGSEFDWPVITKEIFRVASSATEPDNAFISVQYRGSWFYIDDSDLNSKSTFNLLDQLFQLQSGNVAGAGPLLTLPLN
ncbi:MAG: hypothetical protein WBG86_11070 [Polyangiales bacterium]